MKNIIYSFIFLFSFNLLSGQIYPNPATSKLYFNKNASVTDIEIYNIQGELTLKNAIDIERDFIDVDNLMNGTYFLKMISYNSTSIQKFIKQ